MDNGKPILAIETSGSLCGVCVYFSGSKYFESVLQLKNSHAEKLFDMIDFVINSAGIKTGELKAVAVSSGPGSFTGLRIGMSAAKGIAFGSSLPIIAVPTFEALALQISRFLPAGSVFAVANKVNREEIYFAKFRVSSNREAGANLLDKTNNFIFAENLRIINRSELVKESNDCIVFGNAGGTRENYNAEQLIISAPSPAFVAEWASLAGNDHLIFDFDYLQPNYLKNFIVSVPAGF